MALPELIATLAALVIGIMAVVWLVRVIKTTVFTALGIVAIFVVLFVAFGVTPRSIADAARSLAQNAFDWLPGRQ